MKNILWISLTVAVSFVPFDMAYAQQQAARTVTACGATSPFPAPHVGSSTSLYVDTTGTLCSESGGGGGSITSFKASGNYVNATTITTSANKALTGFAGPNAVLKNYGTTEIAFHAAASSTTVTVASADGIIEPGGTWEIALGTNTNIAVASVVSGAISGTGSLQIIDGAGLWTGSGGGGGSGTGGTSSSFGATFPTAGTAAGFEYLSSPPTLTSGQMVAGQADVNGNIKVNCVSGCSGGGGGGSGGSTPQTTNGAPINVSTATTTKIISLTSGDFTYITQFNINTPSTGTVQLEYGTQTTNPCDTGTATITGQYSLATQGGISLGGGFGTALPPIPIGNDVCMITTGGSVNAQGAVSYTQSSTPLSSFGGGGGGLSVTDQTAFTYGTSPFTPIGCVFNNTITALTSGNQGAAACNTNRALYVDVLAGSNFASILGAGTFATGSPQTLPTSAVAVGGQDINSKAVVTPVDPCSQPKSYFDLSTATGTGTQLVAGVSAKKIYLCAGTAIMASTSAHVSLVEGASSTCPSPVGVYGAPSTGGSVTAGQGWPLAANGGLSMTGNTPAATATAGDYLCVLFDTTNTPTVNVHVAYVQE